MADEEVELVGGNTNQVTRKGNVVYRHPQRGSIAIEALLLELERKGFEYSPQFLGRDDHGREMLSYIDGENALASQNILSLSILRESVMALRLFHDHSAHLLFSKYDWQFISPEPACHQTICHNDFGPYNLIVKDGHLAGIIDFDLCGPGPRLRDVAYLAYWMAPLSFASDDLFAHTKAELAAGCPRLRLICDTYGDVDVNELVEMVAEVLSFMGSFEEMQDLFGARTAQRLETEGHLNHWRNEALAFVQNKTRVKKAFQ